MSRKEIMTSLEIFDVFIKSLTLVSLMFAAFSLWQNSQDQKRQRKYQRKQWNFDAFTYYTGRYEQIMSSFPEYMLRFKLDQQVQQTESLSLSALKYLNMTSEEYYLLEKGYLNKKVWEIWLPEIKRTLKTPLFIQQWKRLKREFESYPEFSDFVEKIQSETNLISAPRS
jgi:hypothetical protein